ncbi:MAG TPA: DUF2512 family protein [Symbiobacteriaceae bacterium]|nr:DUF2512 family protein [Symbiobacteriaceae bacterium]
MRQATALALKLVAYLVIFTVTRPMDGFGGLARNMIAAAVLTLLLWFADLLILPRFGNLVATVADAGTLFVGTILVGNGMAAYIGFPALMMVVVAGTVFEWWYHGWLLSTAVVE